MAYDVLQLEAQVASAAEILSQKWDDLDHICPSQREVLLAPYRQKLETAEAALDAAKAEFKGTGLQPVGNAFDALLIRLARQNGYEHLLPARLCIN